MAAFYDISGWNPNLHYQTGGTRSKMVVAHPDTGELYFFKTSLKKEKIDYKYEHWSEIIASEVGRFFGFNTLRYDIAYHNGEIGCISKSMVASSKNRLTEGISYLTGYDNTYNPQQKKSYPDYTFQLISDALQTYDLKQSLEELVKVIIFDSLIGNSDRHQENWGFITEYIEVVEKLKDSGVEFGNTFFGKIFVKLVTRKTKGREEDVKRVINNLNLFMPSKLFSPIYDSGSCLGRELVDAQVAKMLTNSVMLEAYIKRGKAEIRWEKEHLSHFDLIERLKTQYAALITKTIDNVEHLFIEQQLRDLVFNVDSKLPESLNTFKLPEQRKELIVKMITLRFKKLKELR